MFEKSKAQEPKAQDQAKAPTSQAQAQQSQAVQEGQQTMRQGATSQKSDESSSFAKGEAQVDKSASDRLDPSINVNDPVRAPFVAEPEEGEPTAADFAEAAKAKQEFYAAEEEEQDLGETPPAAQPLDSEMNRAMLSPEAQKQVAQSQKK